MRSEPSWRFPPAAHVNEWNLPLPESRLMGQKLGQEDTLQRGAEEQLLTPEAPRRGVRLLLPSA